MTDYVSVDVSEFQQPVNDTYPHRWLSFRACDGSYVDRNVGLNLSWALHARSTGRIDGFTVYVVYRPFKNALILANLDRLGVPKDCVVMIDAETWGGQITGDHSVELNQLADALAARQGSRQRVWGYGNRGDLAALWSGRPAWLGVVVASYGGSRPSVPNMVGWQYTDGQYDVPGLPSSSAPFGPCDHNVFTIQAAHTDTSSEAPLTSTEDDDMAQYKAYRSDKARGGDGAIYLAAPGHWIHASPDDWAVAVKDGMVEKNPSTGNVVLRNYSPAALKKRRHVYLGSNAS